MKGKARTTGRPTPLRPSGTDVWRASGTLPGTRPTMVVQICLAFQLAVCGFFLEQTGTALALYGTVSVGALLLGARQDPRSYRAARVLSTPAGAVPRPHLAEPEPGTDARVRRAVEVERARLRHDLHDGLGPLLSGIGLCAQALSDLLGERGLETEHDLLDRIRAEVLNATAEIRRLVDELPPAAVETRGLVEALRHHAQFARPATAVEIVVSELPLLPPAVEAAVYRIATEAMTNIVRHANARHARVTLAARDRSLRISIADDGRGITSPPTGTGLVSMRRRTADLGGTLAIRTAQGSGTEVTVTLPLAPGRTG